MQALEIMRTVILLSREQYEYMAIDLGGSKMGDNNYIVCNNDLCKYYGTHGKCKYWKTGNCVEIEVENGVSICKSFEAD